MTASLEFEGKNVEKAVQKACEKLNISQDQLNYDVLSYGSTGIFGFAGTKKAKIRVHLSDEATTFTSKTSVAVARFENSSQSDSSASDSADHDVSEEYQNLYSIADNPSDLGRNVLQRIIDSITTDACVAVEENKDRIFFNVVGGNAAILIGKRGQTLEAIQSLVEKIVNKHNKNRIRVQIDIEGYLENRRNNLEKLAARLAEKSKRIRKPISLGQMSAHERRIIHLALKDDPGVWTQSRGEGYYRKLVIFPKNNQMQRRKSS